MTILLIGQTGQVARSLAERADASDQLVTQGRPGLDITDAGSIRHAFDTFSPNLVINASAYTAVDEAEADEAAAFAVNRDGPALLCEACQTAGIPLIHFSTDYVFDGSKKNPYTEEDKPSPLGVYGRSKLAGEQAVAAGCDDHVILRTAWIYGPFGKNFLKTMLRVAREREELTIVDDQWGSPTSSLDIADATLAICNRWLSGLGRAGIFHMVGSGYTTWHGFAREIFRSSEEAGGPTAIAQPIASSDYPTPAQRPANSRLDCTRLKSTYEIELPDWRKSTVECVKRLLTEKDGS